MVQYGKVRRFYIWCVIIIIIIIILLHRHIEIWLLSFDFRPTDGFLIFWSTSRWHCRKHLFHFYLTYSFRNSLGLFWITSITTAVFVSLAFELGDGTIRCSFHYSVFCISYIRISTLNQGMRVQGTGVLLRSKWLLGTTINGGYAFDFVQICWEYSFPSVCATTYFKSSLSLRSWSLIW